MKPCSQKRSRKEQNNRNCHYKYSNSGRQRPSPSSEPITTIQTFSSSSHIMVSATIFQQSSLYRMTSTSKKSISSQRRSAISCTPILLSMRSIWLIWACRSSRGTCRSRRQANAFTELSRMAWQIWFRTWRRGLSGRRTSTYSEWW